MAENQDNSEPLDAKERFKQALEAKKQRQGGAPGAGGARGSGKAGGAQAGHSVQRFQRKSGG